MTAGPVLQQSGDVGTLVLTVVGASLLVVLGLRVSYLAARTRASVTSAQAALWEYYGFAGVLGALYGGFALAGLSTGRSLPFLPGLVLAFALCFALAMREAYYNATLSNAEVDRLGEHRLRHALEAGFVGVVLVATGGPVLRSSTSFLLLVALAAVAVVSYGLYFQHRRTTVVATRGTFVDSLVRHSVPVLVFAGGAIVAPSLALGSTTEPIAAALTGVFVLVTASALLPLTIKLQQHRSSHR